VKIIDLKKNNQPEIINKVIEVLLKGGLVIFPSDTVYGALVDATNELAVKKLIAFKNRPPGKAISVFMADFEMMKRYVKVRTGRDLSLQNLLPGPFTIILKSKHTVGNKNVCSLLESEKGTLGVRIPQYQLINQLIQKFGKPVTATSANLANRSPHYSVKTLLSELPKNKQKLIDLIIDVGQLPRNKPSTVVDLTEPEIKILRKGDVDFLKTKKIVSKSKEETKQIAKNVGNVYMRCVKNKPLVFIIEGELGVGKTVFVKGLGESLGIKNIISPTFVIYYQYGNFYHFDLYRIQDKEEFKYLEIEKLLRPGNILTFEWGEKAGEIYDLLKSKGKIVYVKMKYVNKNSRKLEISC